MLTEDYPIFSALKRGFATGNSSWAKKIQKWMQKNRKFSAYILDELKHRGPLLSSQFEDKSTEDWSSTGWTAGRNVATMLTLLKAQGKIMVAAREGGRKRWDTTEHFLPKWTPKEDLSDHEVSRRVTQLSLRALGVARAKHVERHFIRGCYAHLEDTLTELENEQLVTQVEIREDRKALPGPWYIHSADIPMLNSLEEDTEKWEPRTTLLSPFDNLISDRQRTEQLFQFHFRFEVYTPKQQRKYGCYVMPILHGDHFIGRIDPTMNQKKKQLTINTIHTEPNTPKTTETAQAITKTIKQLGTFLEAKQTRHSSHKPKT